MLINWMSCSASSSSARGSGHGEILEGERGRVLAFQKADDVPRRKKSPAVAFLHPLPRLLYTAIGEGISILFFPGLISSRLMADDGNNYKAKL
jgi:hypothetical protein